MTVVISTAYWCILFVNRMTSNGFQRKVCVSHTVVMAGIACVRSKAQHGRSWPCVYGTASDAKCLCVCACVRLELFAASVGLARRVCGSMFCSVARGAVCASSGQLLH